jgi:hypothetical protein
MARSAFRLRIVTWNSVELSARQMFFHCCIVSFSLDLFLRGTGYFGPWVLLSLAGFYGLLRGGYRPLPLGAPQPEIIL